MPRKPIISTCAGTEDEPANCASIIQLRNLRTQAKRIKTDIEQLKVKHEGLKMAKDDTLKSYIAVKDEKEIFGGVGELMMGGLYRAKTSI